MAAIILCAGVAASGLVGCTLAGYPIGAAPPVPVTDSLTGNWVFTTTSTASPNPFTGLDGFIYAQNPGTADATTASLQANVASGSSCYLGATLIPLYGTVTQTGSGVNTSASISIRSLSVNGQALKITATSSNDLMQLSGTYSISGGCANGAAGTITGLHYAALTGAYNGGLTNSPAEMLSLALTQNAEDGTGSGNFLIGGSATFSGFSCFNSGTIPAPSASSSVAASTIIGNTVTITFTDNDGSQMTLLGTIDQKAQALTLSSITVAGGSCAGSLGPATLTLQPAA